MKINTERVTVMMPPGLYQVLEKLAKERNYSLPVYIRNILWKHAEEKEGPLSRLE